MTFRFQVIDARTGEPEGDRPHRDIGRCLMRVRWLNLIEQEPRYTLRPVRWSEDSDSNLSGRSDDGTNRVGIVGDADARPGAALRSDSR